jgi:rod shape-determining protein MreB
MARDLAIDLGTANTLVYAKGRGIVLNEPSVIALNQQTGDVLAMGQEAWQMIGRTPGYIVAVRPLRQGAITDFDVTQRMIRLLLQRAGVSKFNRPRVVICVPSAITEVERRAVTEAARRAGAADAQLIEQPMAAALGAYLPVNEPIANMVIDVGGGTSETALISLGGVVALQAVRVGSFDIDAAIQTFIRREYGIAVGERTAEEIKVAIGSAWPVQEEVKAEVRGRDLMSGLPKTVILSPEEVREAISEPVTSILDSVITCLGEAPPELAHDLVVRGMHLVGGGGMLKGFAQRIAEDTDIPVTLVDAPLEAVVMGAGRCIEAYDQLRVMFMGQR